MDEPDSEKRIADLGRQLADAQAGAGPQHFAYAAPESTRARRRFRLGFWWLPLLLFLWVAACVALGGYDRYQYHLGAETRATIEHCVVHSNRGRGRHFPGNPITYLIEGDNCTATWDLDGQSQHGPVVTDEYFNAGATLDVHVRDGKAYASTAGDGSLKNGLEGGAILIVLGVFALWLFRRKP